MGTLLTILIIYLLIGIGFGIITIFAAIYECIVNKRNEMDIVPFAIFILVVIVAWPLVIAEE